MKVKNKKFARLLVLAFVFVFTIGFTPASWYGMATMAPAGTPGDEEVTTTESMGNGDFGSDVIDGDNIQAENAVWTVDTAYVDDMLKEHVFTREWVDVKSDTYKSSSDASKAAYLGAIAEEKDGNVSLNPLLLFASAQKWTPQLLKDNGVDSYKDFYKAKSGKVTAKGKAVYTAFKQTIMDPNVHVTTGTVKATATNTGSNGEYSVVANESGGITGDRSGWAIQTKSNTTASISNPLVIEAYAAEGGDSGSWVDDNWSEDTSAEQMTRCGNAVYENVTPKAPKGPTDNPKKNPPKKKKNPPKKKTPEPKKPNENITKKPGAEDLAGDGEDHNDQGEGTDKKPDMTQNDAPIIEDDSGGNNNPPAKEDLSNGGSNENDQQGSDTPPTSTEEKKDDSSKSDDSTKSEEKKDNSGSSSSSDSGKSSDSDKSSSGSSDSGSSDKSSGGSSDSGSSSSSDSDKSSGGSSSSGSSDSGSSSSSGSSDSGSSSSSGSSGGGSSDSGSSSSGGSSGGSDNSGGSDSESSGGDETSSITTTLAAYLPNTVFGQVFYTLNGDNTEVQMLSASNTFGR